MNITSIENALYNWVFGETGLPVIFANSNAPRPRTAYSLINIIQSIPLGTAEKQNILLGDFTVDIKYSNLESIFVSINTFYSGAFQQAASLSLSLSKITVSEQLWADGLGYGYTTEVKNIHADINKRWEQRGQFDCYFFVRSLSQENIETIQNIEIINGIDDTDMIISK